MRVWDATLALASLCVKADVPSCQQADETTLLQGVVRHRHAQTRLASEETKADDVNKVATAQSPTPGFAFPESELPPFTEPSEATAAPPPLPHWPSNAMPLQVLDEATYGDVGGRVLDGSMGNYWYGRGTTNLWVIFQDGGGSCNFLEDQPLAQFDCPEWLSGKQNKYRKPGPDGSSGTGPRRPWFMGNGLLDVDDPDWGDAHHVRVPYLSGDSYLGQVFDVENGCRPVKDTDEEYEPAQWRLPGTDLGLTCKPYFSGHLLLRNIVHHILSNQPDSRQMTRLLLTGSSAGGRSSFMNCDWLQEFLNTHGPGLGMQQVEVSCAPVAGYMLPGNTADHEDEKNAPTPWPMWSQGIARTTAEEAEFSLVEGELHKAYTNPKCREEQVPGEEWRCQMVYLAHKYVGPRVFVSQNTHDFVHMWMDLPSGRFRWGPKMGPMPEDLRETCEGQKYLGYYGDAMTTSLLKRMIERKDDGLFMPSCYDHTKNTRHHGTRLDDDYRTRTVVNGVDALQALNAWFFHRQEERVLVVDPCEATLGAPCNPTCDTHVADKSTDCCLSALTDLCGAHSGAQCIDCAKEHRADLLAAGCTAASVPLVQQACFR